MASQLLFDAPDLDAVESWVKSQPAYAALAFVPQETAAIQHAYLDTADWVIYRAGFSLCIERTANSSVVHLTRRSGRKQETLVQPFDEFGGSIADASGDVSDRVRLLAGDEAPAKIVEVETVRRSFALEQASAPVAALHLDAMTIRAPDGGTWPLSRVEITQWAGGPAIESLAQALTSSSGLSPTRESRFAAALRLAGIPPEAAVDVGQAPADAGATTGEFALATLRRHFSELRLREPGTRLGTEPEDLHQMRVAARRLRSAIAVFRPALPPACTDLEEDLRWAGSVLGEVRDLDVRREWLLSIRAASSWDDSAAVGPLIEDVQRLREQARDRLSAALSSPRYHELLSRLTQALKDDESSAPGHETPLGDFAFPALAKRYRRLRRTARGLEAGSAPAQYHEARKSAKKLRYAGECLGVVLGRPAERLVESAKQVQDLLGEHQDAASTAVWLRESVSARGHAYPPATLLRMGELLERQNVRMAEIRSQSPQAFEKLARRWKRLNRPVREAAAQEASDTRAGAPPVRGRIWLQRLLRQRRRGTHQGPSI